MRNLHSTVIMTIRRLVRNRDNTSLFHHAMLLETRFFRRLSTYCVALLLMFPPTLTLGQFEIEFEAMPDESTGTDFADADFVDIDIPSPTTQQPVEQLSFVQPSVVPLAPLQSTGNPGIANAAYVAVVPNANGGTQYIAPVNGIVLPQAYWNAPNVATAASPPLGSTAVNNATLVAVPVASNGLQLANWNGNTVANPIRLASGSADGTTDTAYLLSTNTGSQFGSIPSGTAVTLLAQAPGYAPIDSLSPATNPAPAGSGFAGPYNYSNSNTSATAGQSSYDPNFRSALSERYDSMMSFMNNLTVNALWMPDSGSNGLGNTELRGQARFAIPCQMLGNEMFYVVPAMQVNFWEFAARNSGNTFKMSDTTFGAWLEAGIEPTLGNEFRFDLWGSVGVYTDFDKVTSECIYVRGRGRAYYQYSNKVELMGGVIYMNRERIRLMPTFGVLWKPSDFLECHLVFPNPKILRYVYTTNNTEWWAYVRGDYDGGSWAMDTGYGFERVDYNDIRIALGLEFRNKPKQCLSGYFEIGGAFNRELYSDGHAFYKPSSCVFLAGGLKY